MQSYIYNKNRRYHTYYSTRRFRSTFDVAVLSSRCRGSLRTDAQAGLFHNNMISSIFYLLIIFA